MDSFIRYLYSLNSPDRKPDTGALAALRRGLSMPPGTCADMFPYVLPHLSQEQQDEAFPIYCLVASLYAFHSNKTTKGNLGDAMLLAARSENQDKIPLSLERRFTTLLRADPDDLPVHLRQTVSLLKSKDIPVNWEQLLDDLLRLQQNPDRVRKAWAQGFWGHYQKEETQNGNDLHSEEE